MKILLVLMEVITIFQCDFLFIDTIIHLSLIYLSAEMFPALANSTSSQMIQHDSNFCSMENEHISYGYSGVHHTTDSGKSEKYSIKSEHREANGQSHLSLSSVDIDFPCSKKADKVFSENEKVQDDFIVSQPATNSFSTSKRRKPAPTRVAAKKSSHEGDDMTEFCK